LYSRYHGLVATARYSLRLPLNGRPIKCDSPDDGSTVYFAPEKPEGVSRGNWIQTDSDKGWFTILRLYSPLPSFFDKSWRPTEIELVN
jgi:hypothetical protein